MLKRSEALDLRWRHPSTDFVLRMAISLCIQPRFSSYFQNVMSDFSDGFLYCLMKTVLWEYSRKRSFRNTTPDQLNFSCLPFKSYPLFCRMTAACQKKCVPPKYSDAELTKGESVCIDRCVAKFMDVHDRIGKKLTAMSNAEQPGASPAGSLPGTLPKWL